MSLTVAGEQRYRRLLLQSFGFLLKRLFKGDVFLGGLEYVMHKGGRFLKNISFRLIGNIRRRKQCVCALCNFSQRVQLYCQLLIHKTFGRFSLVLFCLSSWCVSLLLPDIPMMLPISYLGNDLEKRGTIGIGAKTQNALVVGFQKALHHGIS